MNTSFYVQHTARNIQHRQYTEDTTGKIDISWPEKVKILLKIDISYKKLIENLNFLSCYLVQFMTYLLMPDAKAINSFLT